MNNENNHNGFKMTEIGLLPVEWQVVRFEEQGTFQYGYTTSAIKENTGVRLLRITDIRDDGFVDWKNVPFCEIDENSFDKFKLSEGDLLFARIGATTGKTCLMDKSVSKAIFASYLIRFISDKDLDAKFVFYFTKSKEYYSFVNAGKEGKLKKGLSAAEIKEFKIPFPPLSEQKKIAAVLSAVQEAREKTEAVIAAAKELKKSLMKYLFTYGPVPVAEADKVRLQETEIGVVPEEWEILPLIEIATLQRGKDLPKQKQIPGNVPIVGAGGILGFHNQAVCKGPGVITGRSGSIGNFTYIQEDYWPHNTGLYVKDFNGNNEKFIYYLFHQLDFKKYSTGVSVPTLNRNFVHSLLIPKPSIEMQNRIAEFLTLIDLKIESEQSKKQALDQLFKSLLNNLMTGKIRVNHLGIMNYEC